MSINKIDFHDYSLCYDKRKTHSGTGFLTPLNFRLKFSFDLSIAVDNSLDSSFIEVILPQKIKKTKNICE